MFSLIQGRTVPLYNMFRWQFCVNEMTLDPPHSCQNNLSEALLLGMHLKSIQVICIYSYTFINDTNVTITTKALNHEKNPKKQKTTAMCTSHCLFNATLVISNQNQY